MEARRIKPEDVKQRMQSGEELTFIDARNPTAWAESPTMIPNALRADLDNLEPLMAKIPSGETVVAYCT